MSSFVIESAKLAQRKLNDLNNQDIIFFMLFWLIKNTAVVS